MLTGKYRHSTVVTERQTVKQAPDEAVQRIRSGISK
ncbi:hypothetical protein SC936_08390 [Aggregatibacter actinomycetemcomitans serotype e str. SC936]|nr:hypothetical protein SA3096_03910 [Aggregatibacter actinomycetemcomitans serotype e str. SA3096]KYK79120.1 hypothetical protein SC936_08390 [Aggregatibacter actinomycetemcomitans serotype e str. SC936]KYK95522.1 hypothetical protein ANH9776_04105 [Aggregatibacter actinomycetemcomitans serotype e str. ANH9776]